ncbi:MAG: DNA polymerase I [Firmicutes bacterium]|nr:DNA polymerase I [Bacillota bacterium]
MNDNSKKFVLIDGNSLVNRAFYALPPMNNAHGNPTNAVYGFLTMLLKAITDLKPSHIAVAFDEREKTFRHHEYPLYKATRKGMPDDLASQMPLLKEMLEILGIGIISKVGYEADDIIGTLSKKSSDEVVIITGDRDCLQLVDSKTSVMLTRRGLSDVLTITQKNIIDEYGVNETQVIELKALMGDSSDNIPGVSGIGEKTALDLIEKYSSLDNVYQNIENISSASVQKKLNEGKENAYLSKKLATIETNADIDISAYDFSYQFPFSEKVRDFFVKHSFKSMLKRSDVFSGEVHTIKEKKDRVKASIEKITSLEKLKSLLGATEINTLSIHIARDINFALNTIVEYEVELGKNMLGEGVNYEEAIGVFKPYLENEKIKKVFFSLKQFLSLTKNEKINLKNYSSVELMQYIVDSRFDTSDISQYLEEVFENKKTPATALISLDKELKDTIKKEDKEKLYFDIELPLVEVLIKMEQRGFRVDIKKLDEFDIYFSQKLNELQKEIFNLSEQEFNINSPKQLAKVLFEDMQIKFPQKGKKISTNEKVLQILAEKNEGGGIAKLLLKYRTYSKLRSTYVIGLKNKADTKNFIHTEFKQTLTSTGRLSSVEPNLQNIPVREEEGRMLRGAFIASEGNILVSADYSQIELRLLAHFSDDETLIKAYEEGKDIHAITASEVFGVDLEKLTNEQRNSAKAVNFGIIYGISDFGLSEQLGIPPYKAKEYISKYFEKFPSIKKYLEESVEKAKEKGYASSLLNRTRALPDLKSTNFSIRSFAERAAKNMPLQASAADIIKIAMIEVATALKGFKSKLILQVHDELIVDTDINEVDEVKKILKEKMESAIKLKVPLEVDVKSGNSWLDCK